MVKGRIVRIAANVATLLFGVVIIMQVLLALGILPVSYAWGGRQTELTLAVRGLSLIAIILLIIFAYIIRRRAGLIGEPPVPTYFKLASWAITGYLALNALGNFTSPSSEERILFGPITIILIICCFIVSISGE